MAEPTAPAYYGDAPVTAARHPDAHLQDSPAGDRGYEFLSRTITVNRLPAELYAFWKDFSKLPQIMTGVSEVKPLADGRARWTVVSQDGTVQWESLLTEDRTNALIAWRSVEGSQLIQEGRIEFRESPAGRGTEVTATLAYRPKGGVVGKWLTRLTGNDPKLHTRRQLRRFKQLMETGEIATAAMRLDSSSPPDSSSGG